METGTLKMKRTDLTKLKIMNIQDLNKAMLSIYGEINQWVNEIHGMFATNSILINKLVYYIEKEIQTVNDKFLLNTGWYLYGPCYEDGRRFELSEANMPIKPICDSYGEQTAKVCEELVPRFLKALKKRKVRTDFLKYIYTNKSDQLTLRDYYIAKHRIYTIMDELSNPVMIEKDMDENKAYITESQILFENVFFNSEYGNEVGLSSKEIENITDFTGLLYLYIEQELDLGGDVPLKNSIFDITNGNILKGLASLNYGKTFTSHNQRYQTNIRDTITKKGHELLNQLTEENQRTSKLMFELTHKAG